MHKIRIEGASSHKEALSDEVAHKADGFAAWISRNFLREPFENTIYRKSLIFQAQNLNNPRALINQHRLEMTHLFKEPDPYKLHAAILHSKLLNLYSEARIFPYTSLKYHILLTCAFYYNFQNGFQIKNLYLCENILVDSPFQIIFQDRDREWAILPSRQKSGVSRIYPHFYVSWDRRRKICIGGENQIFDEIKF